MRCHSPLGALVHVTRADLYFNRFATGANHRGVQRLIQVELRHCDVVLEATDHRLPIAVNGAQRSIAILYRIDDDANGHEVEYLIEVSTLLHHFFVQTPQVLAARCEFCIDVHGRQPGVYLTQCLRQIHVALRSTDGN